MIDLSKIPAIYKGRINVIIETPKGSRNKYAYDEDMRIMVMKKTLPEGHAFPFDFGFIPHTRAEDGDPLDVLVMMDFPAVTGCLVQCRLIGAIVAIQKERNKKPERNDRLLAVPFDSEVYNDIKTVKDLNPYMVDQVIQFFVSYNFIVGKSFKPQRKVGPDKAMKLVTQAMKKKS